MMVIFCRTPISVVWPSHLHLLQ